MKGFAVEAAAVSTAVNEAAVRLLLLLLLYLYVVVVAAIVAVVGYGLAVIFVVT